MKRTNHPLDDEFEVEEELEQDIVDVEIPENAKLRDVADMALQDYKETKQSMLYIEPSKRGKFLDLMNSFLTTAKDALDKIEKNEIARTRAVNSQKGNTKTTTTSDNSESSGSVSRKDLEAGNIKRIK
tara:strand:- start:284 stop:667 length:384 start_codon:yes stop_codon:yes gene_type:complete